MTISIPPVYAESQIIRLTIIPIRYTVAGIKYGE